MSYVICSFDEALEFGSYQRSEHFIVVDVKMLTLFSNINFKNLFSPLEVYFTSGVYTLPKSDAGQYCLMALYGRDKYSEISLNASEDDGLDIIRKELLNFLDKVKRDYINKFL